ncbi:MAG: hypothetical protein MUF18_02895 [Fimbriiglobus sp.]|jgi:hypothetical protein|nr:hypothetical protein [Fimbriiglobus sp.]
MEPKLRRTPGLPQTVDFPNTGEWVGNKLGGIPRRFVVAFAVRCALRVTPRVFTPKDQESLEHMAVLEAALGVFAFWTEGKPISRFRIERARGDCFAVSRGVGSPPADAAAHAVAAAAPAATVAAATAAAISATRSSPDVRDSVLHDLERLDTLDSREGWQNDQLVPADFFGPLWASEEPEWSRAGWAKLEAYREGKAKPKPPSEESGATMEQLEAWFAELEKLRAERRPYPTRAERLADMNWLHDRKVAREMGGYAGRYVAVLRGEVVGTDTDGTRLEVAMAHKYPEINPDRFVIEYVG